MPVATESPQVASESQSEEETFWQPGLVKNMVHFFAGLNHGGVSYMKCKESDPSIANNPTHNAIAPSNASKVSLSSKDEVTVRNGAVVRPEYNGEVAGVHQGTSNSSPSYVKLSCALGGYKNYGSKLSTDNLRPNNNNNNVPVNGHIDNEQGVEIPSDLVYTPNGSNYVKGLSQRFENLNGSVERDGGIQKGSPSKIKSNSVSPINSLSYSGASTSSKDLAECNALANTTNGQCSAFIDGTHDQNIDSQNIDFKQARLAFDLDSSHNYRSADSTNQRTFRSSPSGEDIRGGYFENHHETGDGVLNSIDGQTAGDSNIVGEFKVEDNKGNDINCVPAESESKDQNETETNLKSESLSSSLDTLESSSSSVHKDGQYFLQVMSEEKVKIQALCSRAENDLEAVTMSDEASGKLRAAIGKGSLLTTKKFKQFQGLCEQNITQSGEENFKTTNQDLAGFWDLVMIQVDEVKDNFNEIDKLRQNDWKTPPRNSPKTRKPSSSAGVKTPRSKTGSKSTPLSAKAQEAARAREEARRRLLEAKKAGREQRKTSESEDVVEIYVG